MPLPGIHASVIVIGKKAVVGIARARAPFVPIVTSERSKSKFEEDSERTKKSMFCTYLPQAWSGSPHTLPNIASHKKKTTPFQHDIQIQIRLQVYYNRVLHPTHRHPFPQEISLRHRSLCT